MKTKIIFIASGIGLLIAMSAALISGTEKKVLEPAFNPASNPYANGIYANGMIESALPSGENINIFPEVAGVVIQILVTEGQAVSKGDTLLFMDDSMQKANVAQLKAQADAAKIMLEELKHQPRAEVLAVAKAQMKSAQASLHSLQVQLEKQQKSFDLDPQSVSKDTLDNSINSVKVAAANSEVAKKQYELTKAGVWSYDINNQEQAYKAQYNAYLSGLALLAKYTLKAKTDGVILSMMSTVGSYIKTDGVYGSYTQDMNPVLVMGSPQAQMNVRGFIDEILVSRLPAAENIQAKMFIRGTNISVPLEFVRVQPYISPKIELTTQRRERIDVRVLPVIFRFNKPQDINVYPGQIVDIYIGQK
jgi:HlyD family secretion protein